MTAAGAVAVSPAPRSSRVCGSVFIHDLELLVDKWWAVSCTPDACVTLAYRLGYSTLYSALALWQGSRRVLSRPLDVG
jgi:hypothetical protein